MGKTILVTGSSGFVGSHTVKYFSKAGFQVLGLDEAAPAEHIQKYLTDSLVCDIGDERVVSYVKRRDAQGVIHCAAKCLVGESVEKPDLYQDYNVTRSRRFLSNIRAAGIERMIFSSTAATYGEPIQTPIPESHLQKPINPYGATKLQFEKDLLSAHDGKSFKVGIVRYFNAAGADPETELGEVHDPETHLIPNAILAALGKKKEFLLFGTDYETRDGSCERDFVHVWDLAQAHAQLFDQLAGSKDARIYNLGSQAAYTVIEVLDEIDRQTKTKLKRKNMPRRPGDPSRLIADSSKARMELGWKPEWSELPKIISTALSWHRHVL
jgi:UDP-glucose-4-epimerase GalE